MTQSPCGVRISRSEAKKIFVPKIKIEQNQYNGIDSAHFKCYNSSDKNIDEPVAAAAKIR